MSIRTNAISFACVVLLFAGAACGGDDSEGGDTNAGSGGAGGEGGQGGTAGSAGDDAGVTGGMGGAGGAGAGGTGGTSGTGAGAGGTGTGPLTVMCGSETCSVNSLAESFGIAPCCTPDNTCGGLGGMCLPLGQQGAPDESCPSVASAGGFTLSGCCRPDGQCGADYGAVGWGCVKRTDISGYMSTESPLEAVACGGGDEDAGM